MCRFHFKLNEIMEDNFSPNIKEVIGFSREEALLLSNNCIGTEHFILGIIIFTAGIMLLIALASYSPEDPNYIFPKNTEIKNLLGFQGSFISDLFFQSLGLISYLVSFTLMMTGINIFKIKEFFLIIENIFFTILYSIIGTLFLTYISRVCFHDFCI